MRDHKINFKCQLCGKELSVIVDLEDVKRWKDGELIQNALPYLSVDERELFQTSFCSECYDEIFKEE